VNLNVILLYLISNQYVTYSLIITYVLFTFQQNYFNKRFVVGHCLLYFFIFYDSLSSKPRKKLFGAFRISSNNMQQMYYNIYKQCLIIIRV